MAVRRTGAVVAVGCIPSQREGWRDPAGGKIGGVSIERAAPSRSIPPERLGIERRPRRLASGGNFWHLIEFALAVGAGLAAGSVALIGFGADSLIEVFSGSVIVWLFSGGRGGSERAERRAQRLIALSYFVPGGLHPCRIWARPDCGHHPQASWVGIALAAVTAAAMPILARAKRRVGRKSGLGRYDRRGRAKSALRLSFSRAARGAARQRPVGLVVGRSRRRCRDRGDRGTRRKTSLER